MLSASYEISEEYWNTDENGWIFMTDCYGFQCGLFTLVFPTEVQELPDFKPIEIVFPTCLSEEERRTIKSFSQTNLLSSKTLSDGTNKREVVSILSKKYFEDIFAHWYKKLSPPVISLTKTSNYQMSFDSCEEYLMNTLPNDLVEKIRNMVCVQPKCLLDDISNYYKTKPVVVFYFTHELNVIYNKSQFNRTWGTRTVQYRNEFVGNLTWDNVQLYDLKISE